MVTTELRNKLIDRFEGWELVEYLQISIEDVINSFAEEIWNAQEDLEEFITYGR